MSRWALEMGCPLAGGDISTVAGPTVLSVTVIGRAHESRSPVLRHGAREGDGIYVTGAIGGAVRSGRHLSFTPRVAEGRWLCEILGEQITSMLDISDGLGRDAARLGDASGVTLEIEESRVPTHDDAGTVRQAIAEGEDYELLFTASREITDTKCPETGTPITRIGTVRAKKDGASVLVGIAGERTRIDEAGWDHNA